MGENGGHVLETGKADRSVWLMKCPAMVSRLWQSAATSATEAIPKPVVAKVVVFQDLVADNETTGLQFKLELAQNGKDNAPKSYSLNMFKDFVPLCTFSESDQVEGKVEHKFDMEPHSENFGEYGRLCRERTNKAMIKTRQIQVIDNDNGVLMRPMPGMFGLVPSGSKQDKKKVAPVKANEMKRTRRDRTELESIIFKLFERQANWSLKQLVHETDQPEQFLKEILSDLCFYNKRGPKQGTHELKPEYKN